MKLTDKKIIEALKAGKMIRLCGGTDKYRATIAGDIMVNGRNMFLALNVAILGYDFEIVEPEIDWDKVIKEKYLCKFWDGNEEPLTQDCRTSRLKQYIKHSYEPFESFYNASYQHCRPLRADEIKLITDEKEIWK